jgi:hypothetical protein
VFEVVLQLLHGFFQRSLRVITTAAAKQQAKHYQG